jgi:alkylhydroperoxidase family enzyme
MTSEEHIDQLRRAGLDDHGILQLTMLCSYFGFENRVALGLGIPVESEPLGEVAPGGQEYSWE